MKIDAEARKALLRHADAWDTRMGESDAEYHIYQMCAEDLRVTLSRMEESEAAEVETGHGDPDGTERLCRELYGRKPQAGDYLGGSNARMLHDAADRLASLDYEACLRRARMDESEAERDACGYTLADETECVDCERPVCRRTGCGVFSEVGQALCRDCHGLSELVRLSNEATDQARRAVGL